MKEKEGIAFIKAEIIHGNHFYVVHCECLLEKTDDVCKCLATKDVWRWSLVKINVIKNSQKETLIKLKSKLAKDIGEKIKEALAEPFCNECLQ